MCPKNTFQTRLFPMIESTENEILLLWFPDVGWLDSDCCPLVNFAPCESNSLSSLWFTSEKADKCDVRRFGLEYKFFSSVFDDVDGTAENADTASEPPPSKPFEVAVGDAGESLLGGQEDGGSEGWEENCLAMDIWSSRDGKVSDALFVGLVRGLRTFWYGILVAWPISKFMRKASGKYGKGLRFGFGYGKGRKGGIPVNRLREGWLPVPTNKSVFEMVSGVMLILGNFGEIFGSILRPFANWSRIGNDRFWSTNEDKFCDVRWGEFEETSRVLTCLLSVVAKFCGWNEELNDKQVSFSYKTASSSSSPNARRFLCLSLK